MIHLTLLIALIAQSSCAEIKYCAQSAAQSHFSFGTKTTYTQSQQEWSDVPEWTPPSGYRPLFAYGFLRHAIRYPSREDIEDWRQFFDKNTFPASMDNEKCPKSHWSPMLMRPEDDMHVSKSGSWESGELGARIGNKLSSLFQQPGQIDIGVSPEYRTRETAEAFIEGVKRVTRLQGV